MGSGRCPRASGRARTQREGRGARGERRRGRPHRGATARPGTRAGPSGARCPPQGQPGRAAGEGLRSLVSPARAPGCAGLPSAPGSRDPAAWAPQTGHSSGPMAATSTAGGGGDDGGSGQRPPRAPGALHCAHGLGLEEGGGKDWSWARSPASPFSLCLSTLFLSPL